MDHRPVETIPVQPDPGDGAQELGDGQYRYSLPDAEHPDEYGKGDDASAESGHSGDGESHGDGCHHRGNFQDFFQSTLAKKKSQAFPYGKDWDFFLGLS